MVVLFGACGGTLMVLVGLVVVLFGTCKVLVVVGTCEVGGNLSRDRWKHRQHARRFQI